MQMCQAVAEHGSRSVVLQPFSLRLLRPSTYRGRPWPSRTLLLPIPTLAPLITLLVRLSHRLPTRIRLRRQWANDLGWRSFNWSLRAFHPILRWWCRSATVVVHYHLHQPYFRCPNTVVFSHGVEWQRPPMTVLDTLRAESLVAVVNDSHVGLILANDRDYLNEAARTSTTELILQKLRLLANPVDTKRFEPGGATAEQQCAHRTVVMVRNVRRDRGILEGIKAFLLFRASKGYSDWKLNVYGAFSREDDYFKLCLSAARTAGDAITFHGNVSNDLVPGVLRGSSIALVPSQDLEGTSLAALEAMASGVPCVSTPIGGLKDLPTVKSNSIEPIDIAHALIHVGSNYERVRCEQISETHQHFSLEAWKSKFCDALSEVETRRV
jgi:glycosyltransferase involved in cell wall biosynthesis